MPISASGLYGTTLGSGLFTSGISGQWLDGSSIKQFPFTLGQRIPIYCYGDSITANSGVTYDENNRGIPVMLEFYSNGRITFLPQNNYAHGGDNSYDFKEYVTGGTPHNDPVDRRALYIPTNGLCYVDLGANDFGSDAQTYEEFVYNMTTGLQVLLDAGNFIILKNVKPRNTLDAAEEEQLLQMRAWITQKCASNPMMVEMDGSLAIKNSSDWSIATGYSLDGLHLNGAGATAITERAWFDENSRNFIGTNIFPTGNYDFVDSPFSGTGGGTNTSGGTPFYGVVPDGYTIYTKNVSGTAETTWSGDTIVGGGYEIVGDMQGALDDGHEYLYMSYPITGCNTGDLLALQAQIQCTEATNAYWCGMQLVCNPASADRTPYTFSSTTTEADPTSGKVRMNSATASSVTELYLSKTNSSSVNVGSTITTWGDEDVSYIYNIKVYKDSSNYHSFYIVGDIVDNGTWITIPVEYISTTGAISNNDAVKVFPSAVVEAVGGYGSGASISTDFIKAHAVAGLAETRQVRVMGGWTQIEARFNVGLTRFSGQDSRVAARITKLQVDRDVVALAISGTPITSATENSAYTGFTVSATGGTAPYTYSIASGSLPTGVTLNSSTGAVSGTPTVNGSFTGIVIRATDAFGLTDDLDSFDLTVAAAPSVAFQKRAASLTMAQNSTTTTGAASLSTTFDMGYSLPLAYGANLSANDTAYGLRDFYFKTSMSTSSLDVVVESATAATANRLISICGVQLPAALIDSIQIVPGTMTNLDGASGAIEFSIPTTVDYSRSVVFSQPFAHQTSSSSNLSYGDLRFDLKPDGTKIQVSASSLLISNTARKFAVPVIQFKSGVIKNLVRTSSTIAALSTSQPYSLASLNGGAGVNTSNTLILPRGVLQGVTGATGNAAFAYPFLTDGNTVTSKRDSSASTSTTTLDVGFTVIEFNSGYITAQHKEITIASGQTLGTAAITSSADSTSFLLMVGCTYNGATNSEERIMAKIAKDSSTQLSATRTASTNSVTYYVQDIQVLV